MKTKTTAVSLLLCASINISFSQNGSPEVNNQTPQITVLSPETLWTVPAHYNNYNEYTTLNGNPSFILSGQNLWENLPKSIREPLSHHTFRNARYNHENENLTVNLSWVYRGASANWADNVRPGDLLVTVEHSDNLVRITFPDGQVAEAYKDWARPDGSSRISEYNRVRPFVSAYETTDPNSIRRRRSIWGTSVRTNRNASDATLAGHRARLNRLMPRIARNDLMFRNEIGRLTQLIQYHERLDRRNITNAQTASANRINQVALAALQARLVTTARAYGAYHQDWIQPLYADQRRNLELYQTSLIEDYNAEQRRNEQNSRNYRQHLRNLNQRTQEDQLITTALAGGQTVGMGMLMLGGPYTRLAGGGLLVGSAGLDAIHQIRPLNRIIGEDIPNLPARAYNLLPHSARRDLGDLVSSFGGGRIAGRASRKMDLIIKVEGAGFSIEPTVMDFDGNQEILVSIYDNNGRLIKSDTWNMEHLVKIPGLTSGQYLIKVYQKNVGTYTKHIIIS